LSWEGKMRVLAKWTVEDYHRMIEAGILSDRRVELLEGDIIAVSSESPLHSKSNSNIAKYLRRKLNGKAEIFEGHPVTLPDSEPEPDVAIVRIQKDEYGDRHPSGEDIFWLIEVSRSTLARDKNQKKRIYAVAGIKEYWVVDLDAKELIIWKQPKGKDYQTEFKINQGMISSLAFPDIELEVKEMLSN